MYALSEYYLATDAPRGREAAERTYAAVCQHTADTRHGGYFEIMRPDWQPERPGRYGGDRKSLDVHMHMMDALTTLHETTGSLTHRRRLMEIIDLTIDDTDRPSPGGASLDAARVRFAVRRPTPGVASHHH